MKPLGFYVSVPEGHPDHQTLETLEKENGSFFEAMELDALRDLMENCTKTLPVNTQWARADIWNLTLQTCFDLIPFLHQVIKERLVKDVTN